VFSGAAVERWACVATEGSRHAAELDCLVPKGACPGVHEALGQAEVHGYKASQDVWIDQINNKWECLLYLSGGDWKSLPLPKEANALLVDDLEKAKLEKKWINFEGMLEAWGM
jgi:hypothetical protein